MPHSPGPLDVSKGPIPGVQPSNRCLLDLHQGEDPNNWEPIVGPTPFQALAETRSEYRQAEGLIRGRNTVLDVGRTQRVCAKTA